MLAGLVSGCTGSSSEEGADAESMIDMDVVLSSDEPDGQTLFPNVGVDSAVKDVLDIPVEDVLYDAGSDGFVDILVPDVPEAETETQDEIVFDVSEIIDVFDAVEPDILASPPDVPEMPVPDVEEEAISGTFVLDTTQVLTPGADLPYGTMIISQSAAAVFPLFTDQTVKQVLWMGPETISEVSTALGCFGNTAAVGFLSDASMTEEGLIQLGPSNTALVQPIEAEGPFTSAEVIDLGVLIVGMDFNVPQNSATYIPGTYCYGYRRTDGTWVFDFTARDPFFAEQGALGTISVNVKDVDMLAVLFDKTTPVTFMSFQANMLE